MGDEENNLPAERTSDFTAKEIDQVKRYIEDGLPGISRVEDTDLAKMMDLYLSGKTYREISRITRIPKNMVLYFAQKFEWPSMKEEYLRDLQEEMSNRLIEAKLMSHDFLMQLKHMWEKRIGKQINKYLNTNDENEADMIDLKEVDRYLKTIETINKLTVEKPAKNERPSIGLNVGDGVTIKQINNKEVEITPRQKTVGSMLEKFANFKRNSMNQEVPKNNNDISNEEVKGEDNET